MYDNWEQPWEGGLIQIQEFSERLCFTDPQERSLLWAEFSMAFGCLCHPASSLLPPLEWDRVDRPSSVRLCSEWMETCPQNLPCHYETRIRKGTLIGHYRSNHCKEIYPYFQNTVRYYFLLKLLTKSAQNMFLYLCINSWFDFIKTYKR